MIYNRWMIDWTEFQYIAILFFYILPVTMVFLCYSHIGSLVVIYTTLTDSAE